MNRVQNRNLLAATSYILFYVTAIAVLFVVRRDKFVRFHAMQSLLLFGGIFILNLLVNIAFSYLGIFRLVGDFLSTLIVLVAIITWVVSMYMAMRGKFFKWPLVGSVAAGWVGEAEHGLQR